MKIEWHSRLGVALRLGAVTVVLVVVLFSLLHDQRSQHGSPTPVRDGDVFHFGDVAVCVEAREIRFRGRVRQADKSVWFLIHVAGYQWLEEAAAIVSSVRLIDLQQAIALLDWQLWDRLWQRQDQDYHQRVEVLIDWGGVMICATELIDTPYRLGISDLMYLGSPLFDSLFLARCEQAALCMALSHRSQCPLFILHATIEEKFVRECGQRGYLLADERLPTAGTEITVTIRIPDPAKGNDDPGSS